MEITMRRRDIDRPQTSIRPRLQQERAGKVRGNEHGDDQRPQICGPDLRHKVNKNKPCSTEPHGLGLHNPCPSVLLSWQGATTPAVLHWVISHCRTLHLLAGLLGFSNFSTLALIRGRFRLEAFHMESHSSVGFICVLSSWSY